MLQRLRNADGSLSIPQRGNLSLFALSRQNLRYFSQNEVFGTSHEDIRALRERHRPFGVLRSVKHGTPRIVVSSCTPPESVKTNFA